jgi:hypothetical protein
MGAKYSKPCGAIADVKELEYISALLQTEKLELRKDGSIHGAFCKLCADGVGLSYFMS